MYSARFSLDGWNLKEFLKGNWKSIKETAKLLAPGLMTWLTTSNPELAVIVGILAKPCLDVIEFWLKEKEDA